MPYVAGALVVVALSALLLWCANALWVRLISDRWNAMCNEDPPPPAAPGNRER